MIERVLDDGLVEEAQEVLVLEPLTAAPGENDAERGHASASLKNTATRARDTASHPLHYLSDGEGTNGESSGAVPVAAGMAERQLRQLVCGVKRAECGHARLPDVGDRVAGDAAERMTSEEVVLAGSDRAVGVDRESACQAAAPDAARGGHVGDGGVGDLPREVGWPGDDGNADRAEPMVVPAFHLVQVVGALREGRREDGRAAPERLAMGEELADVLNLVAEAEKAVQEQGGRVLLRYSGTEPKARLLIEGRDKHVLDAWSAKISESIKRQIGVNAD